MIEAIFGFTVVILSYGYIDMNARIRQLEKSLNGGIREKQQQRDTEARKKP